MTPMRARCGSSISDVDSRRLRNYRHLTSPHLLRCGCALRVRCCTPSQLVVGAQTRSTLPSDEDKRSRTPDQILTGPQGNCDQPPHICVIRLGEGFRGRQDSPTRFFSCTTGLHISTTDSSDEVVTAAAAPVSPGSSGRQASTGHSAAVQRCCSRLMSRNTDATL